MDKVNRDFRDLFSSFVARDVRFLVVGAYAVTYHSRPRYTKDIDLWIDPSPDNATRAFAALADFGAPLTDVRAADIATRGTIFQIGVEPNRADILTECQGLEFGPCWARRVPSTYDGVPIAYLSREDLMHNKALVGRPKDLDDLDALRKYRPK
jgi:predicted nucleotidyltransferase